jgi:DNA-binding NarL/FixJ family response regulator
LIRVVIADDHPLVRLAVRSYLELEEDFEVIGEAETGEEAVDLVGRERPDLVLLDYQMPVLDGLAAAREIGEAFPEVGIVMLSAVDEGQVENEAAGAGVGEFVNKGDPPDVLADTLRRVATRRASGAREGLTVIVEPEGVTDRPDH